MEPRIGRSISQGFWAAGRSVRAMFLIFGVWAALLVLWLLAVRWTQAPAALTDRMIRRYVMASPVTWRPSADEASQPLSAEQQIAVRRWLAASWPVLVPLVLCSLLLGLVLYGGQMGFLAQLFRTQRASVGDFWSTGWRSVPPLIGSFLLLGIAGLITMLAFILPPNLARVLPASPIIPLIVFVGAIAFSLFCMWWMVRAAWWAVAIVAEQLGPIAGFTRAFASTRTRWWRVLGLLLCLALIAFGVALVVGSVAWAGLRAGGFLGDLLGAISTGLKIICDLYFGFVFTGACVRFYLDSSPAPTP